jgi:hypothetical protein
MLLQMGRIAFDASFRRSREHALPAAPRAALRCPGLPGAPRGHDDLGLHGPPGSDATMMRLIPLRGAHHSCACWHRDASGSRRLHRVHHRQSRWAVPGRHRSCEGRAMPPHHWPRHASDLATSRSRCTSCIPAPRRRTFPQPPARPSATPHADAPPCRRRGRHASQPVAVKDPDLALSMAGEIHTRNHQPGGSLQAPRSG